MTTMQSIRKAFQIKVLIFLALLIVLALIVAAKVVIIEFKELLKLFN